MNKIISLIVLSFILISCSNEKSLDNNIVESYQFSPKLKLNIKGYEENKEEILHYSFIDFCIDRKNNIYILNNKTSEVLIYNVKGDFISKFGNKGNGPGEFDFATEVFCMNDTIYIEDYRSRKIYRFYENKYINSITIKSTYPYTNIKVLDSNRFAVITQESRFVSNKYYNDVYLRILNNKFVVINEIKLDTINTNTVEDLDPLKFKTPYISNDSLIFIPKISSGKYEIDIYDLDGTFKETIKKKYRKINLKDSEKERLNEVLANTKQMGGGTEVSEYKNAINALFIDKNNNLLSFNSVFRTDKNKDHLFVDCFKNDSLLQNINVENFMKGEDLMYFNYKIKFKNDHIYILDIENSELKIYEY